MRYAVVEGKGTGSSCDFAVKDTTTGDLVFHSDKRADCFEKARDYNSGKVQPTQRYRLASFEERGK